jgi:DNA modification methylase
MAFTDPPYNVNYANTAKDKLRGKNWPILNDVLGEDFGALLYDACVNILTVTKGAVYINRVANCCPWSNLALAIAA